MPGSGTPSGSSPGTSAIPAAPAPPSAVDHGMPKVSAEPETGANHRHCVCSAVRCGLHPAPGPGNHAAPCWTHSDLAITRDTAMPGAVGNVAVAGHRQTHGAVLDNIDTLVPGDRIYVQTRDGYYVYIFRNNRGCPSRQDGRPAPGAHTTGSHSHGALPHNDQLQSAFRLRGTDHRLLAAGALAAGVGRSARRDCRPGPARRRGGLSRVRLDLPAPAGPLVASHCHRAGAGRRRAGIDGSVPFSLDGTIHPVH